MAIPDLLYGSVIAFVVAVGLVVIFYVQSQIFPVLNTQLNNTQSTEIIQKTQSTFNMMDTMYLFLYFGLGIAILTLAYLLPSTPITIGILVVSAMISFIILPILTNVYMLFGAGLAAINIETQLPYMFFILRNFPLFGMVQGFLLLILLVAKFRSEPSG